VGSMHDFLPTSPKGMKKGGTGGQPSIRRGSISLKRVTRKDGGEKDAACNVVERAKSLPGKVRRS